MQTELPKQLNLETDNASSSIVRKLASQPGYHKLSIYLPIHKNPEEIDQNAIRVKNAIKAARRQLEAQHVSSDVIKDWLQPLKYIEQNPQSLLLSGRSVALFISDREQHMLNLHMDVEDIVHVGKRYALKQLLPVVNENYVFYVLALARNNCRFFQGTRNTLKAEEVEGLPKEMTDVTWADDPEKSLQSHTGATVSRSGGTGSVSDHLIHGQGGAKDLDSEQIERFNRTVANAVTKAISQNNDPLILIGDEQNLGLFNKHADPGQREVHKLHINTDSMEEDDLHRHALECIRDAAKKCDAGILQRFQSAPDDRKLHQLGEIVTAAGIGRLERTLVAGDETVYGVYNSHSGEVRVLNQCDESDSDCHDLLDLIAQETLFHSGDVYVFPRAKIPEDSPALAVARY